MSTSDFHELVGFLWSQSTGRQGLPGGDPSWSPGHYSGNSIERRTAWLLTWLCIWPHHGWHPISVQNGRGKDAEKPTRSCLCYCWDGSLPGLLSRRYPCDCWTSPYCSASGGGGEFGCLFRIPRHIVARTHHATIPCIHSNPAITDQDWFSCIRKVFHSCGIR